MMEANTEGLILFTRGNPAPEALPVDDLADCARAVFENQGGVVFQYGHYSGYRPLREWLAQKYGVGVDEVLVGNSSMEFFTFLGQVLLEAGDTVYVERPSYDRAVTAFSRLGCKVVGINLTEEGPDMDQLEAELKKCPPKLFYLVPDFQNPTGITARAAQRRRLVDLSRKFGFYLIEDAPYRPLRYWGEEVVSLRELAPERVFYISSFSKVMSPGLRVGYLIGPPEFMPRLHKWSEDTYIHPSLVSGGIAYEYCRRGLLEPNIERLKNLYRPRLEGLLAALETHLDGVRWTKPEGAAELKHRLSLRGIFQVSGGENLRRVELAVCQRCNAPFAPLPQQARQEGAVDENYLTCCPACRKVITARQSWAAWGKH